MHRWIPPAFFVTATAALLFAVFVGNPFNGESSKVASQVHDEPSVVICQDNQIQQLSVPELDTSVLFDDVNCNDLFRWQLSDDFDQLLTVESVGEESHVFVNSLGNKAYDLTELMDLPSTFEDPTIHQRPRFDSTGRVLIVDGSNIELVNPATGEHQAVTLPFAPPTDLASARELCGTENNLLEISSEWINLCPWGWFEPFGDGAVSFFPRSAPEPDTPGDVVAVVITPGRTELIPLKGDLGVCSDSTPSIFWVDSQLICVSAGIGRLQPDFGSQTFSVEPVLEPTQRAIFNVTPSADGAYVYFTTESTENDPGRHLWRIATTAGAEPQAFGRVTSLTEQGLHPPFTLFGTP